MTTPFFQNYFDDLQSDDQIIMEVEDIGIAHMLARTLYGLPLTMFKDSTIDYYDYLYRIAVLIHKWEMPLSLKRDFFACIKPSLEHILKYLIKRADDVNSFYQLFKDFPRDKIAIWPGLFTSHYNSKKYQSFRYILSSHLYSMSKESLLWDVLNWQWIDEKWLGALFYRVINDNKKDMTEEQFKKVYRMDLRIIKNDIPNDDKCYINYIKIESIVPFKAVIYEHVGIIGNVKTEILFIPTCDIRLPLSVLINNRIYQINKSNFEDEPDILTRKTHYKLIIDNPQDMMNYPSMYKIINV